MRRRGNRLGRVVGGFGASATRVAVWLSGLRFTAFYAWFIAGRDAKKGIPVKGMAAAPYVEQLLHHSLRQMTEVEAETLQARSRLEARRERAEEVLRACERLLIRVRAEHDVADNSFQELLNLVGPSEWSVVYIARQVVFGIAEGLLNFMAFNTTQRESRLAALTAALGLTLLIPVACHTIGKRFKFAVPPQPVSLGRKGRNWGPGLFATLLLLLLLFLVGVVAWFRMDYFVITAGKYGLTLPPALVAAFYFLLQILLIAVSIEKAYSLTTPVEDHEKRKLKLAKKRLNAAGADLKRVEGARGKAEQDRKAIKHESDSLPVLKQLQVNAIRHRAEGLESVYRRNNIINRKDRADVPDCLLSGSDFLKEQFTLVSESRTLPGDTNGDASGGTPYIN